MISAMVGLGSNFGHQPQNGNVKFRKK